MYWGRYRTRSSADQALCEWYRGRLRERASVCARSERFASSLLRLALNEPSRSLTRLTWLVQSEALANGTRDNAHWEHFWGRCHTRFSADVALRESPRPSYASP